MRGGTVPSFLLRVLLTGAAAALAASTVVIAPAHAAASGYVRLAHLSPDTPAVDVYLSAQSGGMAEKVFPGVGYGVMSDYLRLPVGGYTVAMRAANAPKSDPPVLTTQVSVAAGKAYTVAGVGRYADLGLRVIADDLTLPRGGKAKVRVVQASVQVPLLDLRLPDGTAIARNVAFASTTDYQLVPPGAWRLAVAPADGRPPTPAQARLGAGNVYSLLVLDGPDGLTTELRTDATASGGIPIGGVETGAGGTAVPWRHLGAAALLLLVAAGALVTLRRRA
ncbi:MAG: DUF4397 domain-containing protein, partial [Hamadaea sp.]|nr:DUF4397 domain-containing protein [Hamadaea sp.]